MKAVLRLMGLMVVALCMGAAAHAADLNGTWKGAFDFQGTSMPTTLHLTVAGAAVTGTIEGLPTSPAEIHEGKIEGDAISFWVNTDYQGTTYKLVYHGKVSADQIAFSFGTDDGSWGAELTVKREGAVAAALDVTGQWKGEWDFNGTSMPLVLNLKSAGATVTGTAEGMATAPIEIHDGKIEGDTVTFWLNSEYQGQTYTLNYKGKVANGQIDFSFGIADGSWGSTVTVKKV